MRIFYLWVVFSLGMGLLTPPLYADVHSTDQRIKMAVAEDLRRTQKYAVGKDWENYKEYQDPRVVFLHTPYFTCSGALVSSHIVLTANHCVWAKDNQKMNPMVIDVYAGGTKSGIQRTHGIRIITNATQKFAGASNDYAILVLEKDIQLPSYFKVASSVKACDGEKGVYALGFPGKKKKDNPWISRGKMGGAKTESCKMYEKYAGCTNDDCSVTTARAEPGSSGSPVFLSDRPDEIIGVMSQVNQKDKNSAVVFAGLETFYNAHKDEPIYRF